MAYPDQGADDVRFERIVGSHWVARHSVFGLQSAYQPLFRAHNDQMRAVAHEALLRVTRGDSFVSPMAFFQSVHGQTLINVETGTRKLHIRNARSLPASGRRIFINFNPVALQSARQFETMADIMGQDLALAGLTPRDVVCEITEQAEKEAGSLAFFVWSLRARGYLIAIDDFGSQSSDLQRVRKLAPDIVKFDGLLVRKLMRTKPGVEMLRDMVRNFQKERIETVLEGLEKPHQIAMARWTGADYFQGYGLAEPKLISQFSMPEDADAAGERLKMTA